MAHPVQPASYMEIANFYTLTVYEKGSEVVGMLYTLLGAELFRQGADLYFSRHDGEAVTIEDFVACMATVSGRDLSQFMHWYRQAGTPEVSVSDSYDADAKTYTLNFRQSCRATAESDHKKPYLIPVKMGLLGADGDLPLFADGVNGATEVVLEITEAEQQVTFNNVMEKPVPSLFRGFSAPVKWGFPYDRDDLMFQITADSDGFNRWEACNQLASGILKEMVASRVRGDKPVLDRRLIDAYRGVLTAVLGDSSADKAMAALMLSLPTEAYLSEEMAIIHVRSIHDIRCEVRSILAAELASEWLQCYQQHQAREPYQPESGQIACRSLKNVALSYLSLLDDKNMINRVFVQAVEADNMTDCHAALVSLVNSSVEGADKLAQQALNHFYDRWRHEPLAVNLWLQIQAGAMTHGGLERVKALVDHHSFDIRNPNKVRSLIGVFCNLNSVNFHRADGAGYSFLADKILELDRLNPQIAARQLTPLTRWRKYPSENADKMKAQLQKIAAVAELSPDVYEVVSKSLAGN